MDRKLYRDERHKVIGGVCAGLAEYFNLDIAIVRLVFVLALIAHGGGFVIYVILWIVLPRKVYLPGAPVDYTVPRPGVDPVAPFAPRPYRPGKAAIIGGIVLIMIGGGLLLDEFDIIPDWDFERTWPIVLVVVGLVLIFSRDRNRPFEQPYNEADEKNDNPSNDNPTIL